MTTYQVKSAPDALTEGVIIIECPHQGRQRVWHAVSEADAINRTCETASRSDTSDYDMTTFDGCMDWNGHDLSQHWVLRKKDVDAECITDNTEVAKAAVALGWVEEVAENEEDVA